MTVFNIQEFVSKFTDMIHYELCIKIGGRRSNSYKVDTTKRSQQNYEGKLYPFYTFDKDKKEIMEYRLAEHISLPVDITVMRDSSFIVVYDSKGTCEYQINNPQPRTKREGTKYGIRILNKSMNQVGFASIDLNAAGDISRETCFYESFTGAHQIMHSASYNFNNEQQSTTCNECTEYTEKDLANNIESVLKVYQVDGIVTAVSFKTQKTKTRDEIIFQSITDITKNSHDEGTSFYLCRCVLSSPEEALKGDKYSPYENFVLENDLLDYQRQKKLSLDSSFHPKKCARWFVEYIENPVDDLFHGFVGEYVGNTFVRDGNKLTLCVHTVKDGNNLYTLIDLTGTDPFIGANPFNDDEERDSNFFARIKKARKIPLFITRKFDNEQEALIAYDGSLEISVEGQEEFDKFAATYIRPFENVKKFEGNFVKKMMKPKTGSNSII